VKLRLYEAEHERLINEINDSSQQPKLRTYKLFKTDCRIEPYLALQQSRKVLTKIARFRTSSHSLKIETGRHHTPIIPAVTGRISVFKFRQLLLLLGNIA